MGVYNKKKMKSTKHQQTGRLRPCDHTSIHIVCVSVCCCRFQPRVFLFEVVVRPVHILPQVNDCAFYVLRYFKVPGTAVYTREQRPARFSCLNCRKCIHSRLLFCYSLLLARCLGRVFETNGEGKASHASATAPSCCGSR